MKQALTKPVAFTCSYVLVGGLNIGDYFVVGLGLATTLA